MAFICNCVGITSGELREAFDKIAKEKGPEHEITFKDVKQHLNLPERMKDANGRAGKDSTGKSRCGSCVESFMMAIKQNNETGEFDPFARPSPNKSGGDDGLCSLARRSNYVPPKRNSDKPPVLNDNPVQAYPPAAE